PLPVDRTVANSLAVAKPSRAVNHSGLPWMQSKTSIDILFSPANNSGESHARGPTKALIPNSRRVAALGGVFVPPTMCGTRPVFTDACVVISAFLGRRAAFLFAL